MKRSEPKMILNLSLEDEEFEKKVKIASEKYVEKIILENLDAAVEKIITRKIEYLIKGYSKVNGVSLEKFISDRTDGIVSDTIDKNIKSIFAKKLAEMIWLSQ